MRIYTAVIALALFAALTGMRGDAKKEVNLLLEGTFITNPDVSHGGVFVMRGEGTNSVITINLPMPPPEEASEEPVKLTYEDISFLEVTVRNEQGEHTLTSEDIESAAYVIEFTYAWDNGVQQQYLVRNNYDGEY